MNELAVAVASAFAVILVISAIGKVDGWGAWSEFVSRLTTGFGSQVRQGVGVAVPVMEAVLAPTLIVVPRIGLEGTSALFICFAAIPAARYEHLQGQRCACFGVVHESTVGPFLIFRNLLLAAAAGTVAWRTPTSVGTVPLLAVCSAALAVLALFVALQLRADGQAFAQQLGVRLIVNRKERW